MNPRWRCPALKPWLQMPLCRLGLPPRSFADDAYDCIMVRICIGSTEYKCVARYSAPDGELPSDQTYE